MTRATQAMERNFRTPENSWRETDDGMVLDDSPESTDFDEYPSECELDFNDDSLNVFVPGDELSDDEVFDDWYDGVFGAQ